MSEFHTIFVISCIAVLAPLLNRIPAFARAPIVAVELLLGMLVGPSGVGLLTADSAVTFLMEFGLVYLFFQAGFEFNQKEITGKPLRLGFFAWLVSLSLSVIISGLLYLVGLVEAPLLVALILPTTAFGILIPVLRQAGDLDNEFGRYVLGVAAVSELGPLILASIVLAQHNHHLHQTLLSALFIVLGLGAIFFLKTARSDRLAESIVYWLGDGELLPIRIALVVLLGFVSFADRLGMELVVGSYMAGMAVAVLVRGTKAEILNDRLTAIGSGFLIPLFFIESGTSFDFLVSLLRQLEFSERTNTEHAVFERIPRCRATKCNFRRVSASASSTTHMVARNNATRRSSNGAGRTVLNVRIAAADRIAP